MGISSSTAWRMVAATATVRTDRPCPPDQRPGQHHGRRWKIACGPASPASPGRRGGADCVLPARRPARRLEGGLRSKWGLVAGRGEGHRWGLPGVADHCRAAGQMWSSTSAPLLQPRRAASSTFSMPSRSPLCVMGESLWPLPDAVNPGEPRGDSGAPDGFPSASCERRAGGYGASCSKRRRLRFIVGCPCDRRRERRGPARGRQPDRQRKRPGCQTDRLQ